jgi:hypothetical protein
VGGTAGETETECGRSEPVADCTSEFKKSSREKRPPSTEKRNGETKDEERRERTEEEGDRTTGPAFQNEPIRFDSIRWQWSDDEGR